jgi:hypothetical protein
VLQKSGVTLEWEIQRVGRLADGADDEVVGVSKP